MTDNTFQAGAEAERGQVGKSITDTIYIVERHGSDPHTVTVLRMLRHQIELMPYRTAVDVEAEQAAQAKVMAEHQEKLDAMPSV